MKWSVVCSPSDSAKQQKKNLLLIRQKTPHREFVTRLPSNHPQKRSALQFIVVLLIRVKPLGWETIKAVLLNNVKLCDIYFKQGLQYQQYSGSFWIQKAGCICVLNMLNYAQIALDKVI